MASTDGPSRSTGGAGRTVAALMVTIVLAVTVGCVGDDAAGRRPNDDGAPTTLPDASFDEQYADLLDITARFPDDLCVLETASPKYFSTPANSYQVELTVAGWSQWLRTVATPLSSTAPEAAATLVAGATQLEAAGATPPLPADFWALESTRAIVDAPAFESAMSQFEDAALDACAGDVNATISSG